MSKSVSVKALADVPTDAKPSRRRGPVLPLQNTIVGPSRDLQCLMRRYIISRKLTSAVKISIFFKPNSSYMLGDWEGLSSAQPWKKVFSNRGCGKLSRQCDAIDFLLCFFPSSLRVEFPLTFFYIFLYLDFAATFIQHNSYSSSVTFVTQLGPLVSA